VTKPDVAGYACT